MRAYSTARWGDHETPAAWLLAGGGLLSGGTLLGGVDLVVECGFGGVEVRA